ncbi:origin recognition complex subunit 2 [Pseudomyrmex gracilis]|uniref:origin recognition complex subunit 2 n=1 Tax=Pseudomyrmex gracilis TaxID=219809 RepID=UPI000995AC98|nr:origin recognition complex subunit 2 [Pseudomyrmex gracilis]
MSSKNLRRSARIKASVKYTENSEEDASDTPDISKSEVEKKLEGIKEDIQKPHELFSDKDVSGSKLYGFQTPKKSNMINKANQCRVSPKSDTPKSLKTLSPLRVVLEDITKKNIKSSRRQYLPNIDSSGDESVSEDSEYVLTDDDSSDSDKTHSSDNNKSSDVSEEENNAKKKSKQIGIVKKSPPKRGITNTPRKIVVKGRKTTSYKDYHINTDEYFESQPGKTITSDRTLGRLRNAPLTKETMKELLIHQNHVSAIHKKRICLLTKNCRSCFPMWQFIMEEGYSLLLHGIGSKRNLINDFHNEVIADHPSLIINGFFPSLTIKDILTNIIEDLLDLDCPTNPKDCLELIEKTLRNNPNDRLYLLIHNIDGIMLRSNKAQNALASLAAVSNIHVIASVDHINAPLLWDHIKRAKFNFYWWDATTFLPYQAETSYESSLLVQQSGGFALSSLQNVFLSLTTNARAIYLILVKYQLNNNSNNFAGMPFKDLYRAAREQFLVSSDLALRTQLTEFIDHKLVRTVRSKRAIDGAEYLSIPLDNGLLKKFLEQYDS